MVVIISQTFFLFDNLDSFEMHWSGIIGCPFYWNVSDAFLMIELELRVWGRRPPTEVKYDFYQSSQGYILLT